MRELLALRGTLLELQRADLACAIRSSRSLTGALFAFAGWRFGAQPASACCGAASPPRSSRSPVIDWDTTLLPDNLTLPLLWAGLLAQRCRLDASAARRRGLGRGRRLSVALVCLLAVQAATGKEGMGYGDFKLLAALGAWFGWQMLLPIILLASVDRRGRRHRA